MNISKNPTCHVWIDPELSWDKLRGLFKSEREYEESSHFERSCLRCPVCGQLYFYEFYEVVDWDDGDDRMYSTWIPVDDVETANKLAQLSPLELLDFPSLRCDDATKGFYHSKGIVEKPPEAC